MVGSVAFDTVGVWCPLSPGIRPCFLLFQPKFYLYTLTTSTKFVRICNCKKLPTCTYNGILLSSIFFSSRTLHTHSLCHVIGFSYLIDLWVIKIKKPMDLCARTTSRSREQSTKRISRSENMRKVCSLTRLYD